MFVSVCFVLPLHRHWFCGLTWENVYTWEEFWLEKRFIYMRRVLTWEKVYIWEEFWLEKRFIYEKSFDLRKGLYMRRVLTPEKVYIWEEFWLEKRFIYEKSFDSRKGLYMRRVLTREKVYIWEEFWNVNLLLTEFDYSEVILCRWQDVKILLLTNTGKEVLSSIKLNSCQQRLWH